MKLSRRKAYSLLSMITIVSLSLIPGIGLRTDNEFSETHYFFGYPAEWFGYSEVGYLVFKYLICCSIFFYTILFFFYWIN